MAIKKLKYILIAVISFIAAHAALCLALYFRLKAANAPGMETDMDAWMLFCVVISASLWLCIYFCAYALRNHAGGKMFRQVMASLSFLFYFLEVVIEVFLVLVTDLGTDAFDLPFTLVWILNISICEFSAKRFIRIFEPPSPAPDA